MDFRAIVIQSVREACKGCYRQKLSHSGAGKDLLGKKRTLRLNGRNSETKTDIMMGPRSKILAVHTVECDICEIFGSAGALVGITV